MPAEKIKNYFEIEKIAEGLKKQNKRIVTTNGSFDILHAAHIRLFEKAKAQGDCLIVLLNSDDSIKRFKGSARPIVPQNERAYMLASLNCVDFVVIFDENKPLNILSKIKPNIHIKGGSWIEERIKEEKKLVESLGGQFKTFELEEGYSTTNIIEEILRKNSCK